MGENKILRRFVVLAVAVFVFVIISVIILGCVKEKNPGELESPEDTTAVTAQDADYDYDGEPHGIRLSGLIDGDVVEYSADGENFVGDEITYVEVGRYEIYYRVWRDGELIAYGKTAVTIAKRILSGISCEDTTVEYDGQAHGIEIKGLRDGDRVGYSPDGVEFSAELSVKEVGEYTIYYIVERDFREYRDSCILTITARRLTITVDGEDIEIVCMAELKVQDVYERVAYDGRAHSVTPQTTGLVCVKSGNEYTTSIPAYTEPGIYEYEFTVIESGYLPTEVKGVLEITESLAGVYYNARGVIVINGDEVKRNGVDIDKSDIRETASGIEYDGEEYVKIGDEKIVEIRIGSTSYVMPIEITEYILQVVGDEIVLEKSSGEELFRTRIIGEIEKVSFCGDEINNFNGLDFYLLTEDRLEVGINYFVLEITLSE